MKHWILLTKENSLAVWIPDEGDQYTYEIAPTDDLKRGDTVYLWSNPHSSFFGWGEVAETPKMIVVEFPRPNNDIELKKRLSVVVNRKKEFRPPITARMMMWDRNLKGLIPKGLDDLVAIYLRPGQAHYINDYVREHKLEPPAGSATVEVKIQEPQFLIKTLLHFDSTTDEGQIVRAVAIPWFEIIERLIKDPREAFQISDRMWEEIIAGAYEQSGFDKVILTPRSGDYGRDVIAEKKGLGTIRIIDQVKAFAPHRKVDANDVRALVGVLHGDGASKAFLTTTSDFAPGLRTDPLVTPFIPSKLELVNGDKLIQRLVELRRK
jgi:restriction system protein